MLRFAFQGKLRQFCGIVLCLMNCLAAWSNAASVLLTGDLNATPDHLRLSRVERILQLMRGLPDGVDSCLRHLLLHSDPRVLTLFGHVAYPLVLRRQRGEVVCRTPSVLHEPVYLTLLLLVRVRESWVVKKRWLQASGSRWQFRGSSSDRPLPEAVQGNVSVCKAVLQVASSELGETAVGSNYRALVVCSYALLVGVQSRAQCVAARVCAVQAASCVIRPLLEHEGLTRTSHPFHVICQPSPFLGVQPTVGGHSFVEMLLGLPEGSQPEVGSADAHLKPGAHRLVLRVLQWRHLPLGHPVAQIENGEGSVAILDALSEVSQVQVSDRAIRKGARVRTNLQGFRVGVESALVVSSSHERIRLILEPHRIALVAVLPSHHWRCSITNGSSLRERWRPHTTVACRYSWANPFGETHHDLALRPTRVRNVFLKPLKFLLGPDRTCVSNRGGHRRRGSS
mmetsp:Transcript_27172/g.71511  ORF Transcript_27172/g.71511 Transcript_27172/m.71511 type:complete len:454 (-) Transcript_27172:725-2086(-)